MQRNGGEALAELLANYGVRSVFGLPGGQTLSFYDGIAKLEPKLRHVLVRDEKSSVLMAIGYSKVTFRPGIADGTAGPGAANMLPSVIEAWASSTPVIVLTSDIVTKWVGKGASQELDHSKLYDSFVKASLKPRNTSDIPEVVRKAFRLATAGRPGPVHVDLPQDILEGSDSGSPSFDLSVEEEYTRYPSLRSGPSPGDVAKIISLIESSTRPLIFAGGGAMMSQAFDEVRELAELIGAPVVTTLTSKGIIQEDHLLSLGCAGRQGYRPGANKAVKEADLILALGTKFAQVATNNWTLIDPARTKLIRVDIDPSEFGKNYKEELSVLADVKSALQDILNGLVQKGRKVGYRGSGPWLERVRKLRAEWVSTFDRLCLRSEPIRAAFVFKEIQRALPPKSVLVSSGSFSGAFAGCFYDVLETGKSCSFIQGRGMAGTETALPLAIGAAIGVQDKVLAVTGDGGFGYHVAELETARRMGLALPVVVLNNNSLAWMKLIQEEKFGSRFLSTNYSKDLSYAKVAESFGCKGLVVERASQLESALKEAVNYDSVCVVEIMTDPSDCSSTHMAGDLLAKEEGASAY